jgi:hypothetical protein
MKAESEALILNLLVATVGRSGKSPPMVVLYPAIFCSVANDSTGGVRTGGDLIYGRISTKDGSQTAYARYFISHGEIGNIDLARTILNDQPISHYSDRTVQLTWRPGNQSQTVPAEFAEFSQNVPASVNNLIGTRLITETGTQSVGSFTVANPAALTVGATYWAPYPQYPTVRTSFLVTSIVGALVTINTSQSLAIGTSIYASVGATTALTTVAATPATTTTLTVTAEEFEAYAGTTQYIAVSNSGATRTFFRVADRQQVVINGIESFYVTTSPAIPTSANGLNAIYSYQPAKYQSSKRVTRLDLNFSAQIWARNSNSELIDFAQIYTLRMRRYNTGSFIPVCHFYIRGQNPEPVYRGMEILNLPLSPYAVEIVPEIDAPTDGLPFYDLASTGVVNTFTSAVDIGGGAFPAIRIQGSLFTNPLSALNGIASQAKSRTPDNSPQRGQTLAIQGVNEIENPGANGKTYDLSFKGYCTVEAIVTFSPQIQGKADFLFFVEEGIITHKLLAAGTADTGSTGSTLTYLPGHGQTFAAGLKLRNTRKRVEANVTAMTATTITTDAPLNWSVGDMWLLTGKHSSCWLPEIYSWLTVDPRFGVSRRVIADHYLDWPVLVENTKWVKGDNEHSQSFAWHGIINNSQELSAWNDTNCKKVMLKPWFGRRKAYEPHRTPINMPAPVIFNASNAKDFELKYTTLNLNPTNAVTVVYSQKEPLITSEESLVFNTYAVSADTWDVARKLVPTKRQDFQNLECTSLAQAKMTAKLLLNIARYEGRQALSLSAVDIESISLRLGHAVRVQTAHTNYKAEHDGVVVAVGVNGFRLDREFRMAEGLTTDANPAGLTDVNAHFVAAGVAIGDLVRNVETGITSPITAVTATTLTCTPIIPIDTYYEIQDMTTSGLVMATTNQAPRAFTVSYVAGRVWYQVAGVQPEVTDAVAIGVSTSKDRLFQVVAINSDFGQPDENSQRRYSTALTCTNWTPDLFNYDDVRVSDRDGVYNAPPP